MNRRDIAGSREELAISNLVRWKIRRAGVFTVSDRNHGTTEKSPSTPMTADKH